MTKLSQTEVETFEKLEYRPELAPIFDPMRYCLRWKDEEPEAVTKQIYEVFIDLLIARKYLHEGLPKNSWWSIEPTSYFSDLWDYALKVIPNWPGFKRLELNKADLEYFEKEKARPLKDHF